MSETTPAAATFEFAGQVLKVPPPSDAADLAFARFCEARALDAALRHRAGLPFDARQDLMDGWRRDVAAGLYAPGGVEFYRVLIGPGGAKEMAFVRLKEGNPDVGRDLVERIFADAAKAEELVRLLGGTQASAAPSEPVTPPATATQ